MNDLDLNLFRVFEAVYRTGNLTRAAGHLHITQPAVSNALVRLRKNLHDPLFVREGQRMIPTPLARSLAPEVFAALDTLQGTVRRTETFVPAASRRKYVLAMREAMELPLLVPLLRALRSEAPHVQLQSIPMDRKRIERQLLSGEVDLAVDVPLPIGEEIRQQPLFEAELCLAMRPKHPLLRKPLTLEGWLASQHAVVSGRSSGPVLEDMVLRQRGVSREVVLRCQTYDAACQLVSGSDVVLVLPRFFGEWFQNHLPLRLVELPIAAPSLQLVMYWSRNHDSSVSHGWLRALVERLAAASRPRIGPPPRTRRLERAKKGH